MKGTKCCHTFVPDPIVAKMREILNSRTTLPDHICSLLTLFLEEKEKIKKLAIENSKRNERRINVKKMGLIQQEFGFPPELRAYQQLDASLKHLKFFIRHTEKDRKMILERAKLIHVETRTMIFDQGDIGESMYVIIKGRVAVQIKEESAGNIPVVVALLKDGEHFGELGLID